MMSETIYQRCTDPSGGPLPGAISGGVHRFFLRVYYEDTDAGGIVYYANYLKFAERARTEMMHLAGSEYGNLIHRDGYAFAVRRCEAEFLSPARLDDLLEVKTCVVEIAGASLVARQVIRRGDAELVQLKVKLACIDRDGRPARIPEKIRKIISTLCQS